MTGTTTPNRVLARAFRVLIVLEALSFLSFALLHLGVRIPVGFAVIEEPRRPFAVIVEGLVALLLALGASAAGFYQQSRKDERPCTWQVVRVVGFDETGRKVAER